MRNRLGKPGIWFEMFQWASTPAHSLLPPSSFDTTLWGRPSSQAPVWVQGSCLLQGASERSLHRFPSQRLSPTRRHLTATPCDSAACCDNPDCCYTQSCCQRVTSSKQSLLPCSSSESNYALGYLSFIISIWMQSTCKFLPNLHWTIPNSFCYIFEFPETKYCPACSIMVRNVKCKPACSCWYLHYHTLRPCQVVTWIN